MLDPVGITESKIETYPLLASTTNRHATSSPPLRPILLGLPSELLDNIVGKLDNMLDVVSTSRTCKALHKACTKVDIFQANTTESHRFLQAKKYILDKLWHRYLVMSLLMGLGMSSIWYGQ